MTDNRRYDIKYPWNSHDDEKFQNNSTVIVEATIADAALQFFHLPPVRDEGGSSDDEADEVTDHDDANHKVEVEELRGCKERRIWIELRAKEAGKFSHVRQDIVTGPEEVHANSDTSDEQCRALGIANIEEETSHLTRAFLDCEGIRECVSNIECHCTHPEEESKERVLNDVAKNFAEHCV